jgi:hypothetical protein
MKTHIRILTLSIAACFGASTPLSAAPFTFTNGDLIIGFQATGGQGTNTNVFFNLGPAINHRDNGNLGVLGNIATTLSAAYGSNWYSRTDLYFGAFGNLNFAQNSGIGGQGPVNGDPSATIYVSQAAAAPGQSLLWTGYTSTALRSAGNTFSGMEQMVVSLTANADNSANVDQTTQPLEWNNGWTVYNPTPGGAFGIFNGGIQQNFGKGGSATHVDVQRILAYTTGAAPTGTVGTGSYETTISIGSDGSITAQSPAAGNSFDTWIGTFNPPLTNSADREATADPDNDGFSNLEEFVLNGNPSVSNQSIAPLLDVSGANFVFSFTRRDDSVTVAPATFQYGSDLSGWTDVPVATSGTVGAVTVLVTPGDAITDGVVVTVPKPVGGKLFGRLKMVK